MRNRFESFAGCILELNRCLQRIKEAEMQKFGLKACHTMCLYYLGVHGDGLTAGELTDLCREDKGAMSRSLAQLTEKELICCNREEGKRTYRAKYFLTEEGKGVVQRMNERIEYAVKNGGNGLTDESRRHFYDAMELILKNLSEYDGGEA